MAGWNPWHGCHPYSAGCENCYVYRIDQRHGRDASQVFRTGDFSLPIKKKRDGTWKIPSGELVYTCFSSDFFLSDADSWRPEAWDMIRLRSDLSFFWITKRIDRFSSCLPEDWGAGWDHVHICCTTENQEQAQLRLPIYQAAPIKHKRIVCEPLLGDIDLSPCLGPWVEEVIAGGESGPGARICRYEWVHHLREQCILAGIPFHFRQTGARFAMKGRQYLIARKDQFSQAKKSGLDYCPPSRKPGASLSHPAAGTEHTAPPNGYSMENLSFFE